MLVLATIAVFPVLTLLLVALTRAENMIGGLAVPAEEPIPTPLPQPRLRLVEADEHLAA